MLVYATRITPRWSDPCNAATGNHDLLVLMPAASVHIEQPADPDGTGRAPLAQSDQRQMLPNADFVFGIDKQVVGTVGHGVAIQCS